MEDQKLTINYQEGHRPADKSVLLFFFLSFFNSKAKITQIFQHIENIVHWVSFK